MHCGGSLRRLLLFVLITVAKLGDSKKPIPTGSGTVFRIAAKTKTTVSSPFILPEHLDGHQTQCMPIPVDFDLCFGMEYNRMRFPNLLGHETMQEVLQQARHWPPLVATQCHSETRKFLCTLFAPVCMKDYEKAIPPCRSLCTAVRDSCRARMQSFGYNWPSMLNCSRFPVDDGSQLCIPENDPRPPPPPPVCQPCHQKRVKTALRKKTCSFDFVLKIRLKRITYVRGKSKIKARKIKAYLWPKSTKKPSRVTMFMKDGFLCSCPVLDNNKSSYLVAGRKSGRKTVELLHVTQWSRKKGKRMKSRLKKCKSKT